MVTLAEAVWLLQSGNPPVRQGDSRGLTVPGFTASFTIAIRGTVENGALPLRI
jgi:hypothetical protein